MEFLDKHRMRDHMHTPSSEGLVEKTQKRSENFREQIAQLKDEAKRMRKRKIREGAKSGGRVYDNVNVGFNESNYFDSASM